VLQTETHCYELKQSALSPFVNKRSGDFCSDLDGLHVDVVANTQLIEQHESLPTLDPGSRANRQGHLSPFALGEDNRAFAQARSCPAPVDPDRRDGPPVLLQQGAALVLSYRWPHHG
jgi:hypothetical protein